MLTIEFLRSLSRKEPKSNRNLILSIDAKLQKFIYDTIEAEHRAAVAIVMKTSGEILSAVSLPSYDPNLFC